MENPIKMDDLGVPLFLETPISYFSGSFKSRVAEAQKGKENVVVFQGPIMKFQGPFPRCEFACVC